MRADLSPHPACPPIVEEIQATVERLSATALRFRYRVIGPVGDIVLPAPAPPLRADNLWRTTCFEAFLAPVGRGGYRELNFSPSSQWAAYDFSAYRAGMVQAGLMGAPEIAIRRGEDRLDLDVSLSLDLDREPCRLGFAAVIEGPGGARSYWAAGHGGSAPDFHHPACFTLEVPPPPAP